MEYFDDIQLINGARILDESGNPVWNGDGIFIPSFAFRPFNSFGKSGILEHHK